MAQNCAIYPKKIEEDPKWQKQRRRSKLPSRLQKRSRPQLRPKLTRWLPGAKKALVEFENLDQKQVDRIVAKASIAALNKHLVLAKMAVDETGRGLVEDKATKNIFACEHVTNYLAGQKTVGIIREDDVMGIDEVAEPVGVVAGVTPVTNPTSTAIFKSLIALKTRARSSSASTPARRSAPSRPPRLCATPPSRPVLPRTVSSGSSTRPSRPPAR